MTPSSLRFLQCSSNTSRGRGKNGSTSPRGSRNSTSALGGFARTMDARVQASNQHLLTIGVIGIARAPAQISQPVHVIPSLATTLLEGRVKPGPNCAGGTGIVHGLTQGRICVVKLVVLGDIALNMAVLPGTPPGCDQPVGIGNDKPLAWNHVHRHCAHASVDFQAKMEVPGGHLARRSVMQGIRALRSCRTPGALCVSSVWLRRSYVVGAADVFKTPQLCADGLRQTGVVTDVAVRSVAPIKEESQLAVMATELLFVGCHFDKSPVGELFFDQKKVMKLGLAEPDGRQNLPRVLQFDSDSGPCQL